MKSVVIDFGGTCLGFFRCLVVFRNLIETKEAGKVAGYGAVKGQDVKPFVLEQ